MPDIFISSCLLETFGCQCWEDPPTVVQCWYNVVDIARISRTRYQSI